MFFLLILFGIFFLWPTPVFAGSFSGQLYEDPLAAPVGFGTSSDNRCDGNLSTPVVGAGFRAKAQRTGEESIGNFMGETYTIVSGTNNSDYTVTLNLPYPPTDPLNPWQCACNANPLDPYQCVFTNQNPLDSSSLNFFIKRAYSNNNAWWQILGGNIFSQQNIQSYIPLSELPGYCNNTPGCVPALIDTDPEATLESPGFAFSQDGFLSTTQSSGASYLHTTSSRTLAQQANATSFDLPIENYTFFAKKMQSQRSSLPSSQKPTSSTQPAIYIHAGNLTITDQNAWHVTNTEQIIVFVQGNLNIGDTTGGNTRVITVDPGGTGFLAFIVSGDIIISPQVGYTDITTNPHTPNIAVVEGVFLADGKITIQGISDTQDTKFIGAGTFVGWDGVELQRSFTQSGDNSLNNQSPAETFIFRPDFVMNTPQVMKSAHFHIREVQPKQLQ